MITVSSLPKTTPLYGQNRFFVSLSQQKILYKTSKIGLSLLFAGSSMITFWAANYGFDRKEIKVKKSSDPRFHFCCCS